MIFCVGETLQTAFHTSRDVGTVLRMLKTHFDQQLHFNLQHHPTLKGAGTEFSS